MAGGDDVHIEVPLVLAGPPAQRHEQDTRVREINLQPTRSHRFRDAAAVPKIAHCWAQRCQDSVYAELETAWIRHTADVRLAGAPMFTHSRCDGSAETHAGNGPVVGIGSRVKRRCGGRLTHLDFQTVKVAQDDELASALEVVVYIVSCGR